MPKTKISHDHTCDKCGKPATVNIQQSWQQYSINEDGEFELEKEWVEGENNFYCEKCFDELE